MRGKKQKNTHKWSLTKWTASFTTPSSTKFFPVRYSSTLKKLAQRAILQKISQNSIAIWPAWNMLEEQKSCFAYLTQLKIERSSTNLALCTKSLPSPVKQMLGIEVMVVPWVKHSKIRSDYHKQVEYFLLKSDEFGRVYSWQEIVALSFREYIGKENLKGE